MCNVHAYLLAPEAGSTGTGIVQGAAEFSGKIKLKN
jgi:hypothetical protein